MRIRGVKPVRSKGRLYLYHRASGERIYADPNEPAAVAREVERLNAKAKAKPSTPGTLLALQEAYRRSPFWRDLRPATRLSYERALAVLEPVQKQPIVKFTTGSVAAIRDQTAATRGRWMANYVVVTLSVLFEFARERDWVDRNPAAGVRRLKTKVDEPPKNRPWTRTECRAVLDAAEPYLAVPIALAMFVGLRKGDVLRTSRRMLADGTIRVLTRKRRVPVAVPVHPELAKILSRAPQHSATTIAANSRGAPWTESGFNSSFGKFIDRLEAAGKVGPGLTMHGLRHNLATRLKEAGADDGTIADLLGQRTTAMSRHYSAEADLPKSTRALMMGLNLTGENESDTSDGKPGGKPVSILRKNRGPSL